MPLYCVKNLVKIGPYRRLVYHNFDFGRLIGNHFCTTRENLVRFVLVTPEL